VVVDGESMNANLARTRQILAATEARLAAARAKFIWLRETK
jgi:hypothetical protein